MDTFENETNELTVEEQLIQEAPVSQPPIPAEEPAPEPEAPAQEAPQPSVYSGAGTGRKESPYANSPYVMNQQPKTQEYQYQPQAQPVKKPKKPRKPGLGKRILAAVLVVALVAGGCMITAASVNSYWENRTQAMMDTFDERLQDMEEKLQPPTEEPGSSGPARPASSNGGLTPSQLYAENVDSVVAISSTIQAASFYGVSEGYSSGSGFILSADGYVVTNYHVVENATAVDVILHNGKEYAAKVVGSDSTNDLAVLKIEAEDLKPVKLGSSSALAIGDMVVAIGNPLGELAATQTVGYVSGINREVTTDNTIINMIQTDAAINPGNSGGPLFNMAGEVIGITTAKYSGTTTSGASIEGIGFAIPMDDIAGSIADLISYGYVTGAYLGVTVQNMDPDSASLYNLPVGAYVVSVVEGGSAHRAGIQEKDIIIDLGGHKVGSITELTRSLRNFKAGDQTTVTVVRGGQELVLDITLDEKPRDLNADVPAGNGDMPDDGSYQEWYDYFFGPDFG